MSAAAPWKVDASQLDLSPLSKTPNPNVPTVKFCNADIGGCGFYRMIQPAFCLAEATDEFNVTIANAWEELETADVVIMQRVMRGVVLDRMQALRRRRRFVLIHEIDDDLWNVPVWNPCSEGIGDSQRDRPWVAEQFSKEADQVWCSTEFLSKEMRRFNRNAVVIPNALDLRLWSIDSRAMRTLQQLKRASRDTIQIGWCGSKTHLGDWDAVWPVICEIDRLFPRQLTWRFVSYLPPRAERDLKYNVVEFGPPVPVNVLPRALQAAAFDIALAPLANVKFNWSKSDLKLLEYWACGYAVVASDVGPYEVIRNGVDGYRCDTFRKWIEKMSLLITRPDIREKLGDNGLDRMRRERTQQTVNEVRLRELRRMTAGWRPGSS